MIVVDASVAVKWFFPEPGEAAAQQLLSSGRRLVAPCLIRVEVAAAITRKARLKEIDKRDAEAAANLWLQSILDGVVSLIPEDADLSAAVKLALALEHPLQDCLYLALAERAEAPLITADEKLVEKASFSHPCVRLLGQPA